MHLPRTRGGSNGPILLAAARPGKGRSYGHPIAATNHSVASAASKGGQGLAAVHRAGCQLLAGVEGEQDIGWGDVTHGGQVVTTKDPPLELLRVSV